ncbi:helix-turn-helix transcriptional regulator [Sphingobacterium faecale]|uniref:Helix-turn-helix domain-containing protein n=1 Tax=Sphingobacterium faecale TaxID=2803775 RepID=A0ABS1R6X2_9SPHI|nr:helix-turn-helix domain-containing protein [Sphingobacterium faecale]MBL1410403.1 helix-turn-helix domain-containing protein [Sphingobacterium faecale]
MYSLQAHAAIQLLDPKEPAPYSLYQKRARYFYLPARHYTLQLPAGRTQLFGFFFRAKLFRNNSERPFRFLHELLQAKREGSTKSLASVDFSVCSRTEQHIRKLMENARMGDFDSEDFVHRQFMDMIKLSRTKVYDEYERTSDPEELIKRFRQRIAERVDQDGASFLLKDIASQLNTSFEHLCRLHKDIHQKTPLTYRDELLADRIKLLLAAPGTLAEISETCRFSDSNSLTKFFKKQTGTTPFQYRENLR